MKRFVLSLMLFAVALPAVAQEPGRGYKPLPPEVKARLHKERAERHGGRLAMQAKFQTLPSAFDCRAKGWVLPIGDQAQCGSCYLYSTIYGTLSQTFVRAGYGKADGSLVMAVQFGMDCHNFGGCNGGNGTEVIDWVVKNGWPAETWTDLNGKVTHDYPKYEARSRTCRTVPGAKLWKPAEWGFATGDQSNRPATVEEIKTALYNYGPLNVSLDAGGQFGNGSGTITSLGNSIDHEIELIAYDDTASNPDGSKGAFLLKNQWGSSWGNGGVRWLTYKASARLVDVFWVTASQLPPPPPPPDPIPPGPGPGPGPGPTPYATLDLNIFGKGKFYVLPAEALDTLQSDAALGAAVRKLIQPPAPADPKPLPPVIETPEPPKDEPKLAATWPAATAAGVAQKLPVVVFCDAKTIAGPWVAYSTTVAAWGESRKLGAGVYVDWWDGNDWWTLPADPASLGAVVDKLTKKKGK